MIDGNRVVRDCGWLVAQNLCASPEDAGTTVHGHGTNITFLNETEIETELRESVFGACDAFIPPEASTADPVLDTASTMALGIFVVAICVLVAAFFVFRRSNEDRDMIKALRGLDQRDLGIDNPLYDSPAMAGYAESKHPSNPVFNAPSNQGYLDVKPGYASSESSSDEDAYDEPNSNDRRAGLYRPSKGSADGAKTLKRLAKEDWVNSMPADVNPMDALEMMFDVKQTREDAGKGAAASGSLAAGVGMSRKERRASKKAAKKAGKSGSDAYFAGAFDSPLGANGNNMSGYADIDPASEFDTDDSRNDEQGYGYDQADNGVYDDVGAAPNDVGDNAGDGLYDDLDGPGFEAAKKPDGIDESGSSSSDDDCGGFQQDAAGPTTAKASKEGVVWMEWE